VPGVDRQPVNPLDQAEPPRSATPDPQPPTPEQAAAIVNAAFADLWWGVLVWLAMTTGARRGELCALRLDLLDLDHRLLTIKTSIGQDGSRTWEKDTKTHQQRRITATPPAPEQALDWASTSPAPQPGSTPPRTNAALH
jgi:integrase